MLFAVEQWFVGRDEKRAPLKTPACEARLNVSCCINVYNIICSVIKSIARFSAMYCTTPEHVRTV